MASKKAKALKPGAVTLLDAHDREMTVGSIVEILPLPNEMTQGLFYVVGFEAGGGRGARVLVALTRWQEWDYKVHPARVSLRCFMPERPKGE